MSIAFAPYPFAAVQYPARIPPLKDGVDARRHPVAIVGGGPVGLPPRSAWRARALRRC